VILQYALEGFKLRSVVDWIWVCITLSSPSQFRHVQTRMKERFGKLYVESCEGNASSMRFKFRIQNPKNADQFMVDIQALCRPGDRPIADADVEIIGLEIALDAYTRGSDRTALVMATAYMWRHLAWRPAGPCRITKPRHYRVPSTPRDMVQALSEGWSVNAGERGADFCAKCYVKDYDTIGSDRYARLAPDQHRAHLELTLMGAELPFTTVAGWREFKYNTLSKRFAMCVAVPPDPLIEAIMDRQLQLGRAADSPKRRLSDRRKRSPFTRKDSGLNDSIRQALRGLTRAQACRNSVKLEPAPILPSLEKPPGTWSAPKYLNTNTATTIHDEADTSDQSKMTLPHPEVVWIKQRGPPP
jgi:hypothetical protein